MERNAGRFVFTGGIFHQLRHIRRGTGGDATLNIPTKNTRYQPRGTGSRPPEITARTVLFFRVDVSAVVFHGSDSPHPASD